MNGAANPHCVGLAVGHTEFDFGLSIAATTHLDSHGERVRPSDLEVFYKAIKMKYYPMSLNHDKSIPPVGVLLSAKLFNMSDGELALAVLTVYYTKPQANQFVVGEANACFDKYQSLIDTDRLQQLHDVEVGLSGNGDLSAEHALAAYLHSHILLPNGRIGVNKHFIAQVGDLKIVVYPKDHKPAHFHVISTQKNLDARFRIDNLKFLSGKRGKIGRSDEKLIKAFFTANPQYLTKLREASLRLEHDTN